MCIETILMLHIMFPIFNNRYHFIPSHFIPSSSGICELWEIWVLTSKFMFSNIKNYKYIKLMRYIINWYVTNSITNTIFTKYSKSPYNTNLWPSGEFLNFWKDSSRNLLDICIHLRLFLRCDWCLMLLVQWQF